MARQADISETYYQTLEYGEAKPNVYIAQTLADILDTTVNWLFPHNGMRQMDGDMAALKLKRKEAGITSEELSRTIGVSVMTYYGYETGERVPDVYTAKALAAALSTDINSLFPSPYTDSENNTQT